jgi:hypothetical protein
VPIFGQIGAILSRAISEYTHTILILYIRRQGKNKTFTWKQHVRESVDVGLNRKFLRFRRDGPFLKRLVACDEKWIFYVNVIRKREWCRPGEAPKPTPKKNLHSKKLMFCVWWDMEGIITSS